MTSSLFGRAGPLIAARLASACLTLVIPLALARLLSQDEYGTYKLLFLVAATSAAVLPFGVAQSLYFFVPRSAAPHLVLRQTLALLLAAGALGGAALWAAGPALASALSTPALAGLRLELAAYTVLAVAGAPLEAFVTSRGRTRAAAVLLLSSDALRSAALVAPALGGLGLRHMMQAMVAWAALRTAAVWALALAGGRGQRREPRLLATQLAYALPFGLAVLFAVPQQYAHQFIVAHAVGPALFAIYAVACFQLPFVDLFYTPTGEVLMVHLGELDRAGRLREAAAAFCDAAERLARLILPPLAFVWAVAPAFVTTLFGPRFSAAAPLFRICVLALPLGVWPLDAVLRARGQTRFILAASVAKAAVSIPIVAAAAHAFGLPGAAWAFVGSEVLGRALLAARVPAALSTPTHRVRARDLVPSRGLLWAGAASVVLAGLGAGALALAAPLAARVGGPAVLASALPLAVAAAAFGLGWLAFLAVGARSARARAPAPVPIADGAAHLD